MNINNNDNNLKDNNSVRAWLSNKGIEEENNNNNNNNNKNGKHVRGRGGRNVAVRRSSYHIDGQLPTNTMPLHIENNNHNDKNNNNNNNNNVNISSSFNNSRQIIGESPVEIKYGRNVYDNNNNNNNNFDEAIVTREAAKQVSEHIQQLDNNNNMNNNPSYANKFIISDTRDRPTQILLKNPCDFSIYCVAYARISNQEDKSYKKVAKHTLSAYKKCIFTPMDGYKYRFKFYSSKSSNTRKRDAFVPVNLPYGSQFDLYYSVKAAKVKAYKLKNKNNNIKDEPKPWLQSTNGKLDKVEEELLIKLLERRARKNRKRNKHKNILVNNTEKYTGTISRRTSSSNLSKMAEKDFELLLQEEEERIARLHKILDEYNNYIDRMKEKVRNDIDNYKDKLDHFQIVVKNYGQDNLRKSREEIRVQSNLIKSRVTKGTKEVFDMRLQYRTLLKNSIDDFQDKKVRESEWMNSLRPILIIIIQYLLVGLNMIGLAGTVRSLLRRAGVPLSKVSNDKKNENMNTSTSDDEENDTMDS